MYIRHGHGSHINRDRTYVSWLKMNERCNCSNCHIYKYYGGRGIKVCKRWRRFDNFLADMGERPIGKTLDRINNDGNYTPKNCRWATHKEQVNKRRSCIYLRYKGRVRTLKQWCEELGLHYTRTHYRLKIAKMSVKEAFETPSRKLRT